MDDTKEDTKEDTEKVCNKCGISKSIDRFSKSIGRSCKDCHNKLLRERRKKRKQDIKDGICSGNVQCNCCNKMKPVSEFIYGNRKCNQCNRERMKSYRESEDVKQRESEYYAQYYAKNKDKMNDVLNEKCRNDESLREKRIYKSGLSGMIHGIRNFVPYLGCNSEEFLKWLVFCFTDDMTIENHGEVWHKDHVLPYYEFDLHDEKQKEMCYGWRNIMPLISHENQVKGNRISQEQLSRHYENLKKYHEENGIEMNQEYLNLLKKYMKMT